MKNVTILDHPLIQHKISLLRNKNTGTNEFRSLTDEIAMLMGYEALRDLPLEDQEVETPIETCSTPMLAGKKLAVVPILRAGLGMVNGILALVPSAKVGHTDSTATRQPMSRTNTTASCQTLDRTAYHRCHRPDAGNRRFRSGGNRLYQSTRRKEHQIHGNHRCSGRIKEIA